MGYCTRCGSQAINHQHHGRDGTDLELCDVCYWRKRAVAEPRHDGLWHNYDDMAFVSIEVFDSVISSFKRVSENIIGQVHQGTPYIHVNKKLGSAILDGAEVLSNVEQGRWSEVAQFKTGRIDADGASDA